MPTKKLKGLIIEVDDNDLQWSVNKSSDGYFVDCEHISERDGELCFSHLMITHKNIEKAKALCLEFIASCPQWGKVKSFSRHFYFMDDLEKAIESNKAKTA